MDWVGLRREFPVTECWAFLDHAGVSAIPRCVERTLVEFAADMAANGITRVGHWADRCDEVRQLIARFIGGDPRGVALLKNTSEAIGMVAEGYPWLPGDNVVLPSDEYPSNQYPWMNLASRGVAVRTVPPRGNRVEIDDLMAAADDRTRLIAISLVGYASGFRIDLAALGERCRERRIHMLVDAIQGLGVVPFDLRQYPVDFVACGSHKWLQGPQGAGFLYVRPELIDMLRPTGVGADSVADPFNYTRIELRWKPGADRFQSGTLNFGGIAAWGEAIRQLADIGPAIADRVRHLGDYLCDGARRRGMDVFSSRGEGDWSGIVSLQVPDPAAMMKKCKAASVVVNHRGGRLRVAVHAYNNENDLDRCLEAINDSE